MSNELAEAGQAFRTLETAERSLEDNARELMTLVKFPDKGRYLELDNCLSEVHEAWKSADEQRKKFTAPLNEVIDGLNQIAARTLKPLVKLKDDIRAKMQEYAREERAWEIQEKARQDATNRKRIEDERIAAAAKAEKQGDNRTAEALINKPVILPKAVVATAAAESKSSNRTVWKARIVDAKVFLHAVADGTIDLSYIEIKYAALDRAATAMKTTMKFPGVEAYEDVVIGSGRR